MERPILSLLFLANLLLLVPSTANATPKPKGVIVVSFEDHDKEVPCKGLAVKLRLDGQALIPTYTNTGFIVPNKLKQLNDTGEARNTRVDVTVTCNGRTLAFPSVYATWFGVDWKVGIDYPPFAHFIHYGMPEKGAWISYLETIGDGDGVEMLVSNPDPLPGMLEQLLAEQPNASDGRARDIAYALAVYKDNYEKNRDYLLGLLRSCLARPKESSEDHICDEDLLDYISNLYWRGDATLLQPLLELADTCGDVLGSIGAFYADLLDRHLGATLDGLGTLDPQQQQVVCGLAGDSLGDVPQRGKIEKSLRESGDGVAIGCLRWLQLGHEH
jgi:hypothetical protein